MKGLCSSLCMASLMLVGPVASRAELKLPRPSPKSTLTQTIGYTDMTVAYSRPGVKARVIWGGLVPYDKPWRTGANEATTFTCSEEVTFQGKKVPAGTYSLFTIPGHKMWTVVLNKEKDLWGAYEYKPEQDVLRAEVRPEQAIELAEWMSFDFENLTPNGGELVLRWERLRLPIKIEVNAVEKALAASRTEIAAAKAGDWRTAFRAADYCFKNDLNAEEAMKWAEKSVKVEGTYLNLSLLAQMKAKAGQKEEAIALAEKAIKAGKEAKEKTDTTPTETLLAEWVAAK